MKLFSTDQGIARAAEDGSFAVLDLAEHDLGTHLASAGGCLDLALSATVRRTYAPDEVRVLAPIPRPGKVIVIGLNYRSHIDEVAEGLGITPDHSTGDPIVYLAPGSAVVGPGESIVQPGLAPTQVDYEGELAVIVGRRACAVSPEEGWSHVAGFSVVNDVSARDLQVRALTSDRALDVALSKSFDTFKPLGPCLLTSDELDEPLDLRLQTWVNGELRQDSSTTDMIHPVSALVSFISHRMTLEPGDVICTGSPRGVGMWRGGTFLADGDVVDIEIAGIGRLSNPVTTGDRR